MKLLYPSYESSSAPDYETAVLVLNMVACCHPGRAEVFYHRGLSWAGMANGCWASPYTAKALNDFAQALSFQPVYPEVYKARAILVERRNPERALADLGCLLSIQPTIDVYLYRAALLSRLERYQLAFNDYVAALVRYITHCGADERAVCERLLCQLNLEKDHGGGLLPALECLIQFWGERSMHHYQY
ncbi:MAG: tetratricopeptide repeat protein [Stenomitos frigidus ULC029]